VLQTWFGQKKERERYYLLPGMGGRNYRRKRKMMLQWGLVIGLTVSGIVAGMLYYLSKR
jgi:hypothetical protein